MGLFAHLRRSPLFMWQRAQYLLETCQDQSVARLNETELESFGEWSDGTGRIRLTTRGCRRKQLRKSILWHNLPFLCRYFQKHIFRTMV